MENIECDNDHLQTLVKLGLTPNQGKLYLKLLIIGKANGRTLSNETKLARQEIYRIVDTLHRIGIVEKILGQPLEFQAVSIQDGISILMMKKDIEFQQTKDRVQKLIKEYSDLELSLPQKNYNFLIIPPRKKVRETRERMLENTKESIQLITTSKRLIQGVEYFFETYEKTLQRNVRTQIIVQESEEKKIIKKKVESLSQYSNFQLRFIKESKVNLLIADKKEAIVTLQPKMDLGDSAVLWTNHPELLSIYQDYFYTVWNGAEES